jgi:hypothetical protein
MRNGVSVTRSGAKGGGKTFRVPRKVREQARYGLLAVQTFSSVQPEALQVANMLASGESVGPAVPEAIRRYYRLNPWDQGRNAESQLYGGKYGKNWAERCASLLDEPRPIVAAADVTGDGRPPWDLTDEEVETMMEWSRAMRGAADEYADSKSEAVEVVEQASDVEDAGEVALEGEAESEEPEEDEEAEVAAPDELSAAAADARRRMEAVVLDRRRRELVARMSGAVLAAAGPVGDDAAEGGDDSGDAVPKAG